MHTPSTLTRVMAHPFVRGARDTLPLMPGDIPAGLVYGVAARSAGLPPWLAQAMSAVIFAGSAQFAVVALAATGASAGVIVLTAALLNLRHMLYGASLAPFLRDAPRRWKIVLAYLLTDETYGVVIGRLAPMSQSDRLRYILGSGLTLWICWQGSTLIGVVIGSEVPASLSLDFAATLTFVVLLVPLLTERARVGAAVAAALVAVVAFNAPLRLGLIIATLAGVAVGLVTDWRKKPASAARSDEITAGISLSSPPAQVDDADHDEQLVKEV
ncbi:MAG: AzlC family ABC transporter permease [Ktedonobacterales bacterium]